MKKIGLCLLSYFVLIVPALAGTWEGGSLDSAEKTKTLSHYFYVPKGAQWTGVSVSANYIGASAGQVTLLVDDHVQHVGTAQPGVSLTAALPNQKSGFHRLDIQLTLTPYTLYGDKGCEIPQYAASALNDIKLVHTSAKVEPLQLRNVPDNLLSDLSDDSAQIGAIYLNRASPDELSAFAKIATAWSAHSPLIWREGNVTQAQFVLRFEHAKLPEGHAHLKLLTQDPAGAASVPTLVVSYTTPESLTAATNALLNAQYAAQLQGASADLVSGVQEPAWSQARVYRTLADFNIKPFAVRSSSYNLQLGFPSAWVPTDGLQGHLAFQAPAALAQGSKLSIWVNRLIAGSMKVADRDVSAGTTLLNYLAPLQTPTTFFDIAITPDFGDGSQCSDSSLSLSVDPKQSTVNLPHRLKTGIGGLPADLIDQKRLVIDQSDGSLTVAMALSTVATKSLLNGSLLKLDVSAAAQPNAARSDAAIFVSADPKRFDERLAAHQLEMYKPFADDGAFVRYQNGRYFVYVDSTPGAEAFAKNWDAIQADIPDAVSEIFISSDGIVRVLEKQIGVTGETPLIRDSALSLWVGLITLAMIIGFIWWIRRRLKRMEARG